MTARSSEPQRIPWYLSGVPLIGGAGFPVRPPHLPGELNPPPKPQNPPDRGGRQLSGARSPGSGRVGIVLTCGVAAVCASVLIAAAALGDPAAQANHPRTSSTTAAVVAVELIPPMLIERTTTTTTTRPAWTPTTTRPRVELGAPSVTGVNWDGIARCETGGNWSMQGPTYSGGVGFANSTWVGFGGREFAPNAGMATREQQIVVAERVYARYGLSGWGCRRYG